jgi:hypothetical protein
VREVVEFWQAVEMFSPPSIPPARASEGVFDIEPGDPLPWSGGHPVRIRELTKNQTWRHTVYLGVFPRGAVFEALESVFPPPPDTYEERQSGTSALLALTVSDDGFLLKDSVVLSACAWAMGRALTLGPSSPRWLAGFGSEEAGFREFLEDEYIFDEHGRPRPVVMDWKKIAHCREAAIETLDVAKDFPVGGIRVHSEVVGKRSADTVEHDFLNSFIADDLARVAHAVGRGGVGTALGDYLSPSAELDFTRRVDVRTRLDEVRRATDPDRVPLGRWPADPERPLALGQQLAVNEAIAMGRGGDGLFAVNGPPGTGKTTMLRDLIAALVTERAERLSQLADPRDAFIADEPHNWQVREHDRVVRRLRPELTGYEMVVASSNNGAVENVTLELPAATAVDPHWRDRARDHDDLRTLAELATGKGADTGSGSSRDRDEIAWALIAARLGRRKFRRGFVSAVWWTASDDDKSPPPPPGLRALLAEWSRERDPVSWAEAVAAFGQARDRAAAIRDDRVEVATALDRRGELSAQIEVARKEECAARDRVLASRGRRHELTEACRRIEDDRDRLTRKQEEDRRPFVLRFRTRAEWGERVSRYAAEFEATEGWLSETAAALRLLDAEVAAHEQERADIGRLEAGLEECEEILGGYRGRPGAVLPDEEWAADREARERQAPWSDFEWNAARTELFLAALDLHRAFLVGAAKEMREALDGAMDVVYGAAPANLDSDAVLAAWQVFFLVVPVVSTTFASLGRLFDRLRPEALGWLLVDEAGQATPQSAVGGLWRARRAVIVGDPLQLEPITTIPFQLEEGIREYFGVDEEWLTGRSSVQGRADRLSRFGTRLGGAGESVWVGAPLTVHRRCDHPMFDLSNRIAYDGLMIDATDPVLAAEFAAEFPRLPDSKWIDVSSEVSVGHWVPAEGEVFEGILAGLTGVGFDLSRAIAIGPFRDVARGLRTIGRGSDLRAGTIHTAQGKEADVVILVLGSDPGAEGARRWAASKPNLLNVAVSRARRRLYVIGDRERWNGLRYFDALAAGLPHAPPVAPRQ